MPTAIELAGPVKLRELAKLQLPRAIEQRPLLKLFPMVTLDESKLIYERRGVYTGVQHARGLGGPTGPARRPGVEQWEVDPGYYGDHYEIDEAELDRLRQLGSWDDFDSYDKQAARANEHLIERFLNRVELSVAQVLTTGRFDATNSQTGQVFHSDAFRVDQYTPAVTFNNLATATPLAFFRDLIPALELGRAVNFSTKGRLMMTRPTANLILNNSNAADLGAKRIVNGSTLNSLDDINKILVANDIPPIEVVESAYWADGAAGPTRFLPNGVIVLAGERTDGQPMGEYRLCRTSNNEGGRPGEWYKVEDLRIKTPPRVIISAGHTGGPVVDYPEAVARINAAPPF